MSVPSDFYATPDVEALRKEYVGKSLDEIPTPAFIVNKTIMAKNCGTMLERAVKMNASFRGHVKTHKSSDALPYQLGYAKDATNDLKCSRVVVSTLMEAWKMTDYYKSGEIDDVLYGLPIVKSRIPEVVQLTKLVKNFRLMIDHESQLDMLIDFSKQHDDWPQWSFFVKVNMGSNRAGLVAGSEELNSLINKALAPENSKYLSLFGFYCHAGHSYSSKSTEEAMHYLLQEIIAANDAAGYAVSVKQDLKLTISVGSTPTSHSSGVVALKSLPSPMYGELELHAGNYLFCDLQQMSTNCITHENVACSVLAEVASCYKGRGNQAPGEVLVNAGVIAMAREPGPVPAWGQVATPGFQDWLVGRLSQEHGLLVPKEGSNAKFPEIGQKLRLIPQHSCITANAYQWYYVVESGSDKVVDVWTTWRGW